MAITLSNGTISVTLPNDLEWTDRYSWSRQKDQIDITLGGSLIIQNSAQLKGRPITLSGGDDYGWMSQADMDTLYQLYDAGSNMTLTLNDGSSYTVRFRYEQTAIRSTPIAPNWDKFNNITISLREV